MDLDDLVVGCEGRWGGGEVADERRRGVGFGCADGRCHPHAWHEESAEHWDGHRGRLAARHCRESSRSGASALAMLKYCIM